MDLHPFADRAFLDETCLEEREIKRGVLIAEKKRKENDNHDVSRRW